jgi:hypothetical protein
VWEHWITGAVERAKSSNVGFFSSLIHHSITPLLHHSRKPGKGGEDSLNSEVIRAFKLNIYGSNKKLKRRLKWSEEC